MKKFIENKNTIIEYAYTPVYIDSKMVEIEKGIFKHKGYVRSIFYLQDIYNEHGQAIGVERIWLDLDHLKMIIKECEEINKLEINDKYDDLPW